MTNEEKSKFLDFCTTAEEKSAVKAWSESTSVEHAAQILKLNTRTVTRKLARIRARAAKAGYAPEQGLKTAYPDNYNLGKVTIQRNSEGEVERTWERMCKDSEALKDLVNDTLDGIKDDIPRAKAPRKPSTRLKSHLLNFYTLTDYHVGMLAWAEETGADWDTAIAEQQFYSAIDEMIDRSPDAKHGVLNIQGDFLHSDGMLPITPTSHNVLDQDSRYHKLVRVAMRMIRSAMERLQQKHHHVTLLVAQGNHDLSGTVWLQELFNLYYERCKRVHVVVSPNPYYAIQHGKTLLAIHHGHKRKPAQFPMVIAAQFPELWGATKYRYGHTGHQHHRDLKEHSGVIIEQHQTLAASDAHAAHGGYFAERGAQVITYHDTHGEYSRLTVRPDCGL